MASAAAQAFFDKQSPQDRMKIIDSWGGADLTDEWFANAQAAGSVPAAGAAAPTAGAAPTIEQLQAQTGGQSEDFQRFQQGDAERWGQYYDAAASQAAGRPQYKSSRGAPGFFDKPTECPAGQTPGGPDETSPCKSTDALMAAQEAHNQQKYGTGAAPGAPGAAPGYFGQDDPLQRMLTNQMASGGGTFAGTKTGGQFQGGGIFSQGSGQAGSPMVNPTATAALTAFGKPSAQAPAVIAPVPAVTVPQVTSSSLQTIPLPRGGIQTAQQAPSDAFGLTQRTGSFDDLVNPRRARKDARMSGSWF